MKKKAGLLKSRLLLLSLCFGLLTLYSCYLNKDSAEIIGSGVVVEETRDVDFFDSIQIVGSANVFFRKDATQSLRLEAEDNIMPIIDTRVENGTLVIESTRSYSTDIGIRVYAAMTEIRRFTINGAANIVGQEAFTTDILDMEIIGAGGLYAEALL